MGDVLSCSNTETQRSMFVIWMDFKERLVARFSGDELRYQSQHFFAVRQVETVALYIHDFEDMSTQSIGLTDRQR